MELQHLSAHKVFSTLEVLRLVPPPQNKTKEDLNQHIRTVLFDKPKARAA